MILLLRKLLCNSEVQGQHTGLILPASMPVHNNLFTSMRLLAQVLY